MATATRINDTRCAHFDSTTDIATYKKQPPKALAPSFLKYHTALLQESLQHLRDFYSIEHIKLLHKAA
eukprot:15090982-Ditylum_brightwellii.AAC.1